MTQIRRNFEPITDDERDVLVESYRELNVPADRLSQFPLELQKLAKAFNDKSQKQLSGTRLLSELLRMRKQAKLPNLSSKRRKSKM